MTYDIRDTMIEAIEPLTIKAYYDMGEACPERIADACLSVIDRHLANDPRTKAETALIEFAEGKARAMRDKGFLLASDVAIPSGILWAFVEDLK